MFDEGENTVTMHLPESVRRLNQANQANQTDEDENADNKSRKVMQIRDYSIDTYNGRTGMEFWKYNEKKRDSPEYVYITLFFFMKITIILNSSPYAETQSVIRCAAPSTEPFSRRTSRRTRSFAFIANRFVARCRSGTIIRVRWTEWRRTTLSWPKTRSTARPTTRIRRASARRTSAWRRAWATSRRATTVSMAIVVVGNEKWLI